MQTAKVLTTIVAGSTANIQEYTGVSDHTAHAQLFTFPNGFTLAIGTLNVLHPAYVCYQSGIPREGKALPSWLNMETQAGLEHAPSSDPNRQLEREGIIFSSILEFMMSYKNVVLCLQECWPWLDKQLHNAAENLGFKILTENTGKKSFRMILTNGPMRVTARTETSIYVDDGTILINNVHLPFATEAAFQQVKACLALTTDYNFIVGDFNVQTQYLSRELLTEGVCTDTLIDFADRFKPSPVFAVHPRGWTNWNVRKNCADPKKNWDHFDNIMLVPFAKIPEVLPIKWNVEMQPLLK